ncbi:MAG TPA: hypothetical protein VIH52_00020 [Candidatus Nanoarchaeia archaeon]|nr:hypothetical protein [uncultured archaeon]
MENLAREVGLFPQLFYYYWEREILVYAREAAIRLKDKVPFKDRVPWDHVGPLTLWELQSYVVTGILLVAAVFVSVWFAIVVGALLALVGAPVYNNLRRQDYLPDVLGHKTLKLRSTKGTLIVGWVCGLTLYVLKFLLAGFQATIFTRLVGNIIEKPNVWWKKIVRWAALSVGLVHFGVSTSHHLLNRAGYSEKKVFRLSVAGSVVNALWRVSSGAAAIKALAGFINPITFI